MDSPHVQYVIADDDVRIGYQDFGSGPPVIHTGGPEGSMEGLWGSGRLNGLFERMAANLRVLVFDHRGAGLSDGFTEPPSLADWALDIKAIMDAVGLDHATLIGYDVGAQIAIGFAASYPERVDRLVLVNSRVGRSGKARADKLYPDGERHPALSSAEARVSATDTVGVEVDDSFAFFSPSLAKHPEELEWVRSFQRLVGSRDVHKRIIESITDLDTVDLAPEVRVPTLIAHVKGNRMHHLGDARLLAELIPGSTLIEFDGDDHWYWLQDNWRDIIDAQIRFTTGLDVDAPVDREFAVVLFTDLVGSTSAAVDAGDTDWRRVLDTHDRVSARIITRHNGTIVKHNGDGVLATFHTPSHAIDAAVALSEQLADLDMPIRAGLHAGEVEIRGDDISGAVVNLAARVEQAAKDGQVYATSTVKDMLIGTTHSFESAGSHQLKGFEGNWPLYRIDSTSSHT